MEASLLITLLDSSVAEQDRFSPMQVGAIRSVLRAKLEQITLVTVIESITRFGKSSQLNMNYMCIFRSGLNEFDLRDLLLDQTLLQA